jgi:hypothetical protein
MRGKHSWINPRGLNDIFHDQATTTIYKLDGKMLVHEASIQAGRQG